MTSVATPFEPCPICGYDHATEIVYEGVRQKIITAHLDDGTLLGQINVDRESRDEPPWTRDDLEMALEESDALLM